MSNFLTQEQVDELPIGTEVSILWSGGNGPFIYKIGRENGVTLAMTDDGFIVSSIDHVGGHPLTVVRRLSDKGEPKP